MKASEFIYVKEAKVEMCPEACCGKPITECKCGPDCKHCDCYEKNKVDEGKSPHKKGTAKYKKHMAAMHAEAVTNEEATAGGTSAGSLGSISSKKINTL